MDKPTTVRTVTLTPNYKNLFNQFLHDAECHMQNLARERHTHHGLATIYTRKEVYDFIASFRIALGSMTDTGDIETLRDAFDRGAEAMHAQLTKEQNEEWEADEEEPPAVGRISDRRPIWDGKSSGGGTFERGE